MGATNRIRILILIDKATLNDLFINFYDQIGLINSFDIIPIPYSGVKYANYVSQIYAKSSFLKSSILKLGQALLAYS